MTPESMIAGDAAALCRTLAGNPDPAALYSALSGNGARSDTLLFEQLEGPSFLLDSAAVRIECRGPEVRLTALSPNGRNLLRTIAQRMEDRLRSSNRDEIRLQFPPIEGVDSRDRLEAPSPFDLLREVTTKLRTAATGEPFAVLALGIIAYDHIDLFEQLPAAERDPLGFPDFLFLVAESLILFEPGRKPRAICTAFASPEPGESRKAYHEASARLSDLMERCDRSAGLQEGPIEPAAAGQAEADLDDREYAALVGSLKEHILAGDVYQIVASRTFRAPCPRPFETFRALRALDPGPYAFFIATPPFHLFGASPETSVRVFVEDGLHVEVKPIAGTRRRGRCPDEDDRLEAELRLDPKEQSEHMMLVDLARNDVARISVPGSRRVEQLMNVERYSRVMHLVSSVRGKLRPGHDALHALKACLNMGTLTGAPKIKAAEILRRAERTKRGPYGGTVGWISASGAMDSAIVIRSAVVMDGTAFVRSGAGIVHDSDPRSEADETKRKAEALLSVLCGAAE